MYAAYNFTRLGGLWKRARVLVENGLKKRATGATSSRPKQKSKAAPRSCFSASSSVHAHPKTYCLETFGTIQLLLDPAKQLPVFSKSATFVRRRSPSRLAHRHSAAIRTVASRIPAATRPLAAAPRKDASRRRLSGIKGVTQWRQGERAAKMRATCTSATCHRRGACMRARLAWPHTPHHDRHRRPKNKTLSPTLKSCIPTTEQPAADWQQRAAPAGPRRAQAAGEDSGGGALAAAAPRPPPARSITNTTPAAW